MLREFRDFIMRGNVLDLAIGVIIGTAFSGIVTAFTKYLINPILGLFTGQINFDAIVLKIGPAVFKIGSFLNALINFIIIAFVLFLIVKAANRFSHKQPAAKVETPEETYLKEIRDLLAKDQQTTEK